MHFSTGMSRWVAHVITGCLAASAIALVARAAGPPTADPLVYRGVLEEGGAPVTGSRDVQLRLWNDATGTAAANLACTVTPGAPTTLEAGRFSLVLGAECVAAVHVRPHLWVEVLVDNVSLGRSPIGAVPYALEAGRPTTVNPTTGRASSRGSYCGSSTPVAGSAGGYAGAKAMCETACSSPTAHVCSSEEWVTYLSTGGGTVRGRVQTGTFAVHSTCSSCNHLWVNDCGGWTQDSSSVNAVLYQTGPEPSTCFTVEPFLCCD